MTRIDGIVRVRGSATGPALVLEEPLSFWGGLDPATGEIIDRHHPQVGVSTTGTVLVLPHGRGSSGASSVLAECIRTGSGPIAIVTREPDGLLLVGALVAGELYPDRPCPVVEAGDGYDRLATGVLTHIHGDGTIEQHPAG